MMTTSPWGRPVHWQASWTGRHEETGQGSAGGCAGAGAALSSGPWHGPSRTPLAGLVALHGVGLPYALAMRRGGPDCR
jgi:hypothetical protein